MKFRLSLMLLPLSMCTLLACNQPRQEDTAGNDTADTTSSAPAVDVPSFNADTAYRYVSVQAAMGPRVPGTPAQRRCAAWMEAELKKITDTVYKQDVQVTVKSGKKLPCINLIGVIHPKATKRILFLTHWDSRPWADMDVTDKDKPIIAADDAGSGVGVLLEMARQIQSKPLPADLGIDILFTDVEDYGKDEWEPDSYCLGTQYWGANPHVPGYKANFGILLDMVGARNAVFPMEGVSYNTAGDVQQKVWQAAGRAGYSSFFPFKNGGEITDDHVYVNRLTHIPTIDIINLAGNGNQPFAPHWHTHKDNMDIIDKNTLKAVGQTLLQVVYETAKGS